jgi:multiple sugar transport system substrate-binding protein
MENRINVTTAAILCMVFVSCSIIPPLNPPTKTSAPPTDTTTSTPKNSTYPTEEWIDGAIQIRWFVGLGTGSDPGQLKAELAAVNEFNRSHDIQLVLEIIPYDDAQKTLSNEITYGNGPDIVGPVSLGESNAFHDQWLDLTSLIESNRFDTSQFNPALMEMYKTPEGLIGLPFAVYPSTLFYNKKLFDDAGLAYPPAHYGEKYRMSDGSEVEWSWDTLREVARLLTIDAGGRNAAQSGFNNKKIIQYGFTWQYEDHPNYWGSFWERGTMVAPGGSPGNYTAQVPDAWKAAWKWTYDGIWGNQPFIAASPVNGTPESDSGYPFNGNHVAITDQPFWYTCCMKDVKTWDAAAMPTYHGKVGGRIDADTFHIWKGTKHPQEAFTVLAYLVSEGVQTLIIGSSSLPPPYGAIPARTAYQNAWLVDKKIQFPWVENWEVILEGLNYPDIPSADAYMPNHNDAWARGNKFADLLRSTGGLDLDKEIQAYASDLKVIFNQ